MSVWVKDEHEVYRIRKFGELPWLDHGFGTRHSQGFNAFPAATVRQIHSDRVLSASGEPTCVGEGDAMITDQAGLRLAVRTADCIPVLLADRRRRIVAAVHAGWRGTLGRIAQGTVDRMRETYGTRAEDLEAAIGPGIGVCCFEVGSEVAALFGSPANERAHLDLHELNRQQLLDAGLGEGSIHVARLCTRCGETEFHSFRRDRERAGRMVSSIVIR